MFFFRNFCAALFLLFNVAAFAEQVTTIDKEEVREMVLNSELTKSKEDLLKLELHWGSDAYGPYWMTDFKLYSRHQRGYHPLLSYDVKYRTLPFIKIFGQRVFKTGIDWIFDLQFHDSLAMFRESKQIEKRNFKEWWLNQHIKGEYVKDKKDLEKRDQLVLSMAQTLEDQVYGDTKYATTYQINHADSNSPDAIYLLMGYNGILAYWQNCLL